jgi:hypothetical protein
LEKTPQQLYRHFKGGVVLGDINSSAVRCRSCRRARRIEKNKQKAHMAAMAERKAHAHEAFFKKRF